MKETRAKEAENRLAEQETKTKALVEMVKKQKSEWEQKIQTAEAEAEKWRLEANRLKSENALRSEQLENVTYRLDSLVALNEKNAKEENPERIRIAQLERSLNVANEGILTHKRELDIKLSEYKDQIQELNLKIKLMEKDAVVTQEQLKMANERAFEAEGRLAREQALSRELSSQLNQLRYGTKPSNAAPVKVAVAKPNVKALKTELDDLDFGDLEAELAQFGMGHEEHTIEPVSMVTSATHAVATSTQGSKPVVKKNQDWGDIDNLLDDISTSAKTKK